MSKGILKRCMRFRRSEDGNATIEFVFLFPTLMAIFLMGFEAGFYMVKTVMLEHGVDVAVRDVRIANGGVPNFDGLKKRICNEAAILPDCVNSLQIEMRAVETKPQGVEIMRGPARCIDVESSEDSRTGTEYEGGDPNELMLIRVCSLSRPIFPTTRLSSGMIVDNSGNYAIVSTSSFVTEPGQRVFVQPASTGGMTAAAAAGAG